MAMKIEKQCREVVDGIAYNVTYLCGENGRSIVYDPVRTPEQQAKRDREICEAVADFGRAMLSAMGEDWFREHLQVTETEYAESKIT
jgi:hypothetical protein